MSGSECKPDRAQPSRKLSGSECKPDAKRKPGRAQLYERAQPSRKLSGCECGCKRQNAIVLFVLFVALLISQSAMAQEPRLNVSPNLFGSVPQGSATANVLPLSVSDAIDRALKYNLGPI